MDQGSFQPPLGDSPPTKQTAMPCPVCGAGTYVAGNGGRYLKKENVWLRVRKCDNRDEPHVFETYEAAHILGALMSIPVNDVTGRQRTYSRDRLLSDLSRAVGAVLPKPQRNEITSKVEARLMQLAPISRSARREVTFDRHAVVTAVAETLKQEGLSRTRSREEGVMFRRAHLLYWLARGPIASVTGDGFTEVRGLQSWLENEYYAVGRRAGTAPGTRPHYATPRRESWHPLKNDAAPEPAVVRHLRYERATVGTRRLTVERFVHLDPQGNVSRREEVGRLPDEWRQVVGSEVAHEFIDQPFSQRKFLATVLTAFVGRTPGTEYNYADHCSRYIVQWVLWALAGQSVVRESDLASLATQCLRRVDAIAYARWAIVMKSLDEVGLWEELQGLEDWPAARLDFPAAAAADVRQSAQLQPMMDDFLATQAEYGVNIENGLVAAVETEE